MTSVAVRALLMERTKLVLLTHITEALVASGREGGTQLLPDTADRPGGITGKTPSYVLSFFPLYVCIHILVCARVHVCASGSIV